LITLFILSLVKVQTVHFNRLAVSFDSSSQSDYSLRRIQRFFASFAVDMDRKTYFDESRPLPTPELPLPEGKMPNNTWINP
jgi:hypothetical protein